jgi:hypothetical protein
MVNQTSAASLARPESIHPGIDVERLFCDLPRLY